MSRAKWVMVMAAAVVSVLALISGPVVSNAQSGNPCDEDMRTVCSDVTQGGGRLLSCYEQRKDKISVQCKAWVEAAKANAEVAKKACAKEIETGCSTEKGDPLEMLDCLQGHYLDLSKQCMEQLNQFKYRYPPPVKK
jgi:hypothetical protein